MATHDNDDCPGCGSAATGDRWCSICGLDLAGEEAAGLRELTGRLAATEVELQTVLARRDALTAELVRRRWEADRREPAPPVPAFRPFDRPPRTASSPEWGVEKVRNLLLWTGAALLALSALAFTAVAWTHLSPGGRAALLVALTVVSAITASALRMRLPATAGAFTGLTIAFALIDWQVVRRAGVAPGLSTAAWWSIGTMAVAALSAGMARVAAPVPARRAIALLLPTSAVLGVAVNAHASWSVALELAIVAFVTVAVNRVVASRLDDAVIGAILRLAASGVWVVGALFAVDAAIEAARVVETIAPAAAMLALALAPRLAVEPTPGSASTTDRAPMAFLVIAAVIGAGLTLASTSIGPIGMMTLAAAFGAIAIAIAPRLTVVWRRATYSAGVAAGAIGLALAVVEALVAELGPLAWLAHSWTGSTAARAVHVVGGPNTTDAVRTGWCEVGILILAAAAIAATARPRPERRRAIDAPTRMAGAVAFVLLAVVLIPVAAGWSALAACAVTTGAAALSMPVAALVARRRERAALTAGLLVAIPAIPAAGWAVLTPATSVTVLSVVVVSALLAATLGRNASLRSAHAGIGSAAAITLTSVAMLASGSARSSAGFVALVVAGGITLAGSWTRRDTLDGLVVEIVSSAGMVGGVLLAIPSPSWVAAGLTAMVPILLGASVRRDRTAIYGVAAGASALAATWAWLASADVTVVEAYTVPAAAFALAVGRFAWKAGRARSWLNLGPAVALGLLPTLALAIARNDDGRAVAVGIAALAVLLVGARQQLQAPIVLGAIVLLTLGLDKLGPQAVRLPRWIVLAMAGALLLWVGTTFERRRDDVQRAARHLADLG